MSESAEWREAALRASKALEAMHRARHPTDVEHIPQMRTDYDLKGGRVSEPIEPVLSVREWVEEVSDGLTYEVCYLWGRSRPATVIALANAALPDTDPRKITWATVELLRSASTPPTTMQYGAPEWAENRNETQLRLLALADTLASYLPPR